MAVSQNSTNLRPIKCVQINLQHSKAATYNLVELLTKQQIDIAFLQEPFLYENKPTGIPSKFRLYASGSKKCRAAVVVLNKSLDALIINQLSDDDAAVIEIRYGALNLIVVSMYFDIRENIERDTLKLEKILDFAKGRGVLAAIDTNSRSKLWYDTFTNSRGKILEEFVTSNDLYIINEDNGRPTFESSRGSSKVDLTLCSDQLLKEVYNWNSGQEESCSDHSIINFTIGSSENKENYTYRGIRYIVRDEDYTLFDEHFSNAAREIFGREIKDVKLLDQELYNLTLEYTDVEDMVRKFQETITLACRKAFRWRRPAKGAVSHKSVPWWTMKLTIMRKKVNAQRRRFQRTLGDEELRLQRKRIYQDTKRQYQSALRQEKFQSWKEYCNITTNSNPWNAVYKLASGKIRNSSTLSTLMKKDGTYTTSLADTVTYMMDRFIPDDDQGSDSEYHKLIRNKVLQPPDTGDDKPFTQEEIKDIIVNMNCNKAPGEDGITSNILHHIFTLAPEFVTALYNKCLEKGIFPMQWKRAKIVPIVKPGKENCIDVSKYRPISLLNVAAKLFEKLFINRIMHYLNTNDLLSKNQFGFRPQTSTVDAIMEAKDFIEEGLKYKESVAMISLDVEGAFNSAWWPGILNALRDFQCPKNMYELTRSYLSDRRCTLSVNTVEMERNISKGCPQGSCCGPGLWNIQYDSLLKLNYKQCTKVIAYADDLLVLVKGDNTLEIENRANIELGKISSWAKQNKIIFNKDKTKVLLITRKKTKQPHLNIYINNGKIEETDSMKYLGILFDKRLRFHHHIEQVTEKSKKLIHALSKSAKINWGLRSDVIKIIYKGAILPLISYGIPAWIDALSNKHNTMKIRRMQRLVNIKMTKAFRTTSHEALCILAGTTPIDIELRERAKYYCIIRGRCEHTVPSEELDLPVQYCQRTHPAEKVIIEEKTDENYVVELYTDGSKTEIGTGAGIAVFINAEPVSQMQIKIHNRCSNNQAEQLAILKALEKLQDMDDITPKTAAIHTDSQITLDLLKNNRKQNKLVEEIKKNIQTLQLKQWKVHFEWVKAHVGNEGNELADRLAKQAANSQEIEVIFSRIPTSTILRELKEESVELWENEWQNTINGHITKLFFPTVRSRMKLKIMLNHKLTAFTTGHGKFGDYFHRFKIVNDPTCVCKQKPQTVEHILWECEKLNSERAEFRRSVIKSGGEWPVQTSEIMEKHYNNFKKFINKIELENFQII